MKKIIVSIILIAMLILFIGCTNTNNQTTRTNPFNGGTIGLLIDISTDAPPEGVTAGGDSPFTVTATIENKGEEDVLKDDVFVKLRGFDAEDFGTTPADMTKHPDDDVLKTGRNQDTGVAIPTTPVYIDFNLNYKSKLTGAHEFPIVADLCYKYKTRAVGDLCIKSNLLKPDDARVCTISGTKTIYNSGAPVHIATFDEFAAGKDKVSFTFSIKTMGNGDVSRQKSSCSKERADEDKVYVTVNTNIAGLVCSGLTEGPSTTEGYVRLSAGERTIRCTQTLSADEKTDKIVPVDITLEYDYKEIKETSIFVKEVTE